MESAANGGKPHQCTHLERAIAYCISFPSRPISKITVYSWWLGIHLIVNKITEKENRIILQSPIRKIQLSSKGGGRSPDGSSAEPTSFCSNDLFVLKKIIKHVYILNFILNYYHLKSSSF